MLSFGAEGGTNSILLHNPAFNITCQIDLGICELQKQQNQQFTWNNIQLLQIVAGCSKLVPLSLPLKEIFRGITTSRKDKCLFFSVRKVNDFVLCFCIISKIAIHLFASLNKFWN